MKIIEEKRKDNLLLQVQIAENQLKEIMKLIEKNRHKKGFNIKTLHDQISIYYEGIENEN